MKPEIKAIIFDVGGVVIFYDHMIAAKQMSRLIGINPKRIFNILSGRRNMHSVVSDLGESSRKYWALAAESLGVKKIPYKKFDRLWNTIFWSNKKMFSLILKLKRRYKTACISNTNFNHKNYVLKTYKLKKLFDVLTFSCDVKMRKPHKNIYLLTLKKLGVKPEEAVFIDDKHENVASAAKLGINGILFRNNKQAIRELEKLLR